jgi:hypothetical protein
MANCYLQIRCGRFTADMVVGREYDFSVGRINEKLSPETLLEQIEKIVLKGLEEKHGQLYELNGSCDDSMNAVAATKED